MKNLNDDVYSKTFAMRKMFNGIKWLLWLIWNSIPVYW